MSLQKNKNPYKKFEYFLVDESGFTMREGPTLAG